jgi:hypothetical protein
MLCVQSFDLARGPYWLFCQEVVVAGHEPAPIMV